MELVLLAVMAVLLLAIITLASRQTSRLDHAYFQKRWKEVQQTLAAAQVGPRMAVIDADRLLDQALKQSNVRGETMGERLKNARGRFKNNQAIWEAHKLRNRLVHEDVQLKKSDAHSALNSFHKGLKDLGAL
jgi:hypothetical protein